MAAPVQRTWVVGEVVTASEMNSNVRDAVNWVLGGSAGRRASFRVWQNLGQNITNGVATVLKYDTVGEDTDSGYSAATGIWTCAQAGLYLIVGGLTWASGTTGARDFVIQTSASPAVTWSPLINGAFDGTGRTHSVLFTRLAAGTQVSAVVTQTTSGVIATNGGTAQTYLTGAMIAV